MSAFDDLLAAVQAGDLAGVRASLAAGADPNESETLPLRQAASLGHADIVQTLLAADAGVHAHDDAAIRFAVQNGHLAVVRLLLSHGADISAFAHQPLRSAVSHGHEAIVRLLRECGAELKFILTSMGLFSPAVQIAALCNGDLGGFSIADIARNDACPEALCALLAHQGHAELATTITATRMLEPLSPAERATLLTDLLAEQPQLAPASPS